MSGAKILVVAATVAALGTGLAGCTAEGEGPAGTPGSTDTTTATVTPPERTTLDVAVYGDTARVDAYRAIVDAFEAEQPEVSIDLASYPDAAAAAEGVATRLDAAAGPDVFLLDQVYLSQFVEEGRLQPVDTLLEDRGLQFGDDYQRVALTAFGADAGLLCMPAETSPLVLYYNKKLVPRRQLRAQDVIVPRRNESWRWETFVATARSVAGVDQLGPVKGVHVPADLETLTAFVRSAGGEVVDDVVSPTTLTLASDDALETLDEIASFARDSSVGLTEEELAERDPVEWFAMGSLGMYIGTRDDVPRLREAEGLRFDVLSLPSFGRAQSVTRMNGYCISAESDLVEKAADFIAFAVGEQGSEIAAASEVIVPSSLDMIHSDAFIQPGQQPRNSGGYLAAIRRSEPMPFSTAWLEVSAAAEPVLERLYRRPETDLEATLERRMLRLDALSQALFALDEQDEDTG